MGEQSIADRNLALRNSCLGFLMAYEQRNVDRMLDYCSNDAMVHFTPLGEAGRGNVHELGKGLWSALIDSFPNLENTVTEVVTGNDDSISCQVIIRGSQTKEFAGIPSKGKDFESDHIFIFRLDEHQMISALSITWDHADFQRQLS